MRALAFYSLYHADLLKKRAKNCTLRLGDKRNKYIPGDIVMIIVGKKYQPRQKLFYAVIDSVEVRRIRELSEDEIKGENPNFQTHEDVIKFLESIYERPISYDDIISVVFFSPIEE